MRRAVRNWSRALIVPIVSVTLTVYPFSVPAAHPYSLSGVAKVSAGNQSLPTFTADADSMSPIDVRNQAWSIADAYYPAERYELDVLADSLDYEAEQAFVFLRDQVNFDPYRGVMRGSEGALGAQAGNAIDRALLLREILDTMGYESRLVFGELDDDAARDVLAAAVGNPGAATYRPRSDIQLEIARAAKGAYNWLVDAVDDDSIGTAVGIATIADVRDHAWVQMKDGSKWVDLDPSLPDAEFGSRVAEPQRYATEAPKDDFVVIEISVVAETLTSGALTEAALLEYDSTIAEAERAKIFLYFEPYGTGQGRALAEALGPGAQFKPVIQVGEERKLGNVIPGIIATPEQMSDAKEFIYGTENAVTSALYMDVEVTGPDGSVARERRVLFDRVPSTLRAGADIDADALLNLREHDGTPVAYQEFHQVLVSGGGSNPRTVWNDVGYAAWFPEKLKELGDDEEMTTEEFLWQLGLFQATYPVLSEEFSIPALNDLPDTRFYVGAPRVFVLSMAMLAQGEDALPEQSIDLLLDDVQVVSAGASSPELAQRKVWYGVLQSALETSAIQSAAVMSGTDAASVESAFYDVGGEAVVLRSADDLGDSVNYPARLIEDLAAGRAVVHVDNERTTVDTWWAISPGDGSTKAMLGPGLGGGRFGGSGGGSGGSRNLGGYSNRGKATNVQPDLERWATDPEYRNKPSNQPPGRCKVGGNEYLTTLCNIAIAMLNPVVLLAIAVVVGFFILILILRQLSPARIGDGSSGGGGQE